MQQQGRIPLEKDIEDVDEVGEVVEDVLLEGRAVLKVEQLAALMQVRKGTLQPVLGQTGLQARAGRVRPDKPQPLCARRLEMQFLQHLPGSGQYSV